MLLQSRHTSLVILVYKSLHDFTPVPHLPYEDVWSFYYLCWFISTIRLNNALKCSRCFLGHRIFYFHLCQLVIKVDVDVESFRTSTHVPYQRQSQSLVTEVSWQLDRGYGTTADWDPTYKHYLRILKAIMHLRRFCMLRLQHNLLLVCLFASAISTPTHSVTHNQHGTTRFNNKMYTCGA